MDIEKIIEWYILVSCHNSNYLGFLRTVLHIQANIITQLREPHQHASL